MATDHRATALEHLQAVRHQLGAGGGGALVAECDALIKAVEAFHMEAIRFRMYGLHRRLTTDSTLPADAAQRLEEARTALSAAGFKV